MSRTLSGLLLVGALNRPRKRKGTNRENPRTIPGQIGKIPGKSGKRTKQGHKRKDKSRSGDPPVWTPPPPALWEGVLDQNVPEWSKRPVWSKWPSSELDSSIREAKMSILAWAWRGTFWSIYVRQLYCGHSRIFLCPKFFCESGVAPANQTKKVSSWTFRRGVPEQKFNVNRACFPKENHQNSQKRAKFMNFSFWPFLWFGLLGRLLSDLFCDFLAIFLRFFCGKTSKGPFRTKNAMALETVVFYYCRSVLLCLLICCNFSQEKQHLQTFCRSKSLWP